MLYFSRLSYLQAKSREWWLTNGLGGFSSSTLAGCHTRRYHGLLTASLDGGERLSVWAKGQVSLGYAGQWYALDTNEYRDGTINPHGYRYLLSAAIGPSLVKLTYQVGGILFTQEISMLPGQNATLVRYTLVSAPGPVEIVVEPLVNQRDYHGITQAEIPFEVTTGQDHCEIRSPGVSGRLVLTMPGASFQQAEDWHYNLNYQIEKDRGLPEWEDLFRPGRFAAQLQPGEMIQLTGRYIWEPEGDGQEDIDFSKLLRGHNLAQDSFRAQLTSYWRQKGVTKDKVDKIDPTLWSDLLHLAEFGQNFLVKETTRTGVIAGLPWFTQWGRDTMISLPGLCLASGNAQLAREILISYAQEVKDGLFPNRFTDTGGADYNTVDAGLWFIVALYQYWSVTEDRLLVDQAWPGVYAIISSYLQGTKYGIKTSSLGLLAQGTPGYQLTWMDAKVGEWVVTPRQGYPVEVNALWYNALQIGAGFAALLGRSDLGFRWQETAELLLSSFNREFWNGEKECLYDLITPEGEKDSALRPNQLLAVSLPFPVVPRVRAKKIVDQVYRELYIPGGLRTLAPGETNYHRWYQGLPQDRDAAYHQGTAWIWLLGPFISAFLKVHDWSPQAAREAKSLLDPVRANLQEAGIGYLSEILEPEYPYQPRGCPAQAWSVAEVLRSYLQEILPALCSTD